MIGEYTLLMLCQKYNIDSSKIVKKNNNILSVGDYNEIDKTLNYLINELKISSTNIEKCPSILYRNVNAIKYNVEFLKNKKINFNNIESCLHVLSSEPVELEKTFNYVTNNYGSEIINTNTSILSANVDAITYVENLNLPIRKNGNLPIAIALAWGSTSKEEIQKIIQSKEYKERPELFTSETLARAKYEEILRMI